MPDETFRVKLLHPSVLQLIFRGSEKAGLEASEAINYVTVSSEKKYLAVCERSSRAQCSIFDIAGRKYKKTIPNVDQEVDFTAKEFLSCAFAPKEEMKHLITMLGSPDYCLLFW